MPDLSWRRSLRSLGGRTRCLESRRQNVCLRWGCLAGRFSENGQHRDCGNVDRCRSRDAGAVPSPLMGSLALGDGRRRAAIPSRRVVPARPFEFNRKGASTTCAIRSVAKAGKLSLVACCCRWKPQPIAVQAGLRAIIIHVRPNLSTTEPKRGAKKVFAGAICTAPSAASAFTMRSTSASLSTCTVRDTH